VLAAHDVKPMECEGEPFDPHLHEAVMREADSDLEADHVAQVVQKGYWIGERVLRPARVAVSS
jgi:molecular chaperone GrpE